MSASARCGVAGRVRRAELDPRRALLAGPVRGNADEGRARVPRPADRGRSLEPGQQPLVRVHPLVRHGGQLGCVPQDSAEERGADGREQRLRILGVEGVAARVRLEQRHVEVHARAGEAVDRLRHERREHAELARHLLHGEAERRDRVRHRERVGVLQVELVLRRADLVVRRLDGDAHQLEVADRRPAEVAAVVERRLVEVRAFVERGRRLAPELAARTGRTRSPGRPGTCSRAPRHAAAAAGGPRASRPERAIRRAA